MIRPLLVSYSDTSGGAARATYRLHRALRAGGVESELAVRRKSSDDLTVREFGSGVARALGPARSRVQGYLQRLQRTPNPILHSSNVIPSGWGRHLAGDVVNLHWVGAAALSIADVARIEGPVVMTLHDMWGFCGAEHYAPDNPAARWVVGYTRKNRPAGHRGLDLDRLTWLRKRRHWRQMTVVVPSQWLADCVRQSALMNGWPVHAIPNPLDLELFRPFRKNQARARFGIRQEARVILFGAVGGSADPRKGFDLLVRALAQLEDTEDLIGVVFGQDDPDDSPCVGIPLYWLGRIEDDETLAMLYSAADVMVVPSRQEAFGQTASEAQACGTPVVAFDTTGLRDVVDHGTSGYLVEPFESGALAKGIAWVLGDADRRATLGGSARQRAKRLWAPRGVVEQYLEVYEEAHQEALSQKPKGDGSVMGSDD